MTSLAFVLSDLETGRIIAHAVLCAEARYASVLKRGASRIDRHLATAFQWLNVEQQLGRRIKTGPLHRGSPIVALLLDEDRRAAVVVQHLVSTPLDVEPYDADEMLDAHLRDFAAMPPATVRPSG